VIGSCGPGPGKTSNSPLEVVAVAQEARLIIFLFPVSFCKGVLLPPGLGHSALWRMEDSFAVADRPRAGCWSFVLVSFLGHISLRDERRCLETQTKNKK
jgi:hypothetical protein